MIKNLVGPPVFGNDFVGRKQELFAAKESLSNGNSLLLASPRRVGKSSFAHHLVDDMKKNGWSGLYVDLQGIQDENDLSEQFVDQFSSIPHDNAFLLGAKKYMGKGLKRFKKVEVKDVGFEINRDASEALNLAEQYVSETRGRCVVVLDEVAVFLEELTRNGGINRTERVLNWLRKLRVENSARISWVYCSSISIQSFCSIHNLSHTINDFQAINLGELSQEDAAFLLSQLDETTKYFKPEDVDFILKRIGFKLPYFIQLFYSKYNLFCKELEGLTLDDATEYVLDKIEKEQSLDSWSERLKGYGEDQIIARSLLNYISQPSAKTDRGSLKAVIGQCCQTQDIDMRLSNVRQMLERDGYIMSIEDGSIVFRSPIIRDYWFKKFVK